MAFAFVNDFDEMDTPRLKLRVIAKEQGNEKEIPYYWYEILRKPDLVPVGRISIRIGHNHHSYYNGNMGYEVDEAYRGRHYALEAAKVVLKVARYHGMDKLYIACDEDNAASYRTIEGLGARLAEITEVPEDYVWWYEGIPRQRIYELMLSYGAVNSVDKQISGPHGKLT